MPFESDSLPVHVLLRFSHAILQSNSLPYAFFTISHQIPPDRPLPNCSTFSFPSTDHAMSQISLGPCHIPYQFYILSFFNEDFTSYLNNMIFFFTSRIFFHPTEAHELYLKQILIKSGGPYIVLIWIKLNKNRRTVQWTKLFLIIQIGNTKEKTETKITEWYPFGNWRIDK